VLGHLDSPYAMPYEHKNIYLSATVALMLRSSGLTKNTTTRQQCARKLTLFLTSGPLSLIALSLKLETEPLPGSPNIHPRNPCDIFLRRFPESFQGVKFMYKAPSPSRVDGVLPSVSKFLFSHP